MKTLLALRTMHKVPPVSSPTRQMPDEQRSAQTLPSVYQQGLAAKRTNRRDFFKKGRNKKQGDEKTEEGKQPLIEVK